MKIIRSCTVAQSTEFFVGMIPELARQGYEVVTVSSDGPELQRVIDAGGRAIAVAMERRMAPLKDLRSLFGLIRVFRRERPSMVHSMTPKAGLLSMMAARLCGVPVRVHTFTGLVFPTATGLTKKILIMTDRLTCACATHVIPEGEGVKADLINHGITRKPLRVLGHGNVRGIDLSHFDRTPEVMAKAAELRRDGTFTFIFIGRLVRDKGINELVAAFSELHKTHPDTRLLLIGREEKELDPIDEATRIEIERNPAIIAPGETRDVRPWLAASDALVCPSYREGFPNVVIEAGAMGLPSIVTDINGSREIILDGRNGVIIPPRDKDALLRAMEQFITNPARTAEMASESRPLIASRFEQSYVRRCLKDYYKEILR